MTVKELKQYRSICKEISEKNTELKERTLCGAVRGSGCEFPYIQHTISVSGVTSIPDNRKLSKRVKWLENQKQRIDDFIDDISDSDTRMVFELRYIKGCRQVSWQKIAFKLGKTDESYPRKRIHNEYLKKQ